MDIGTGKDIGEYTVEGRDIPYHLVDIVDAGYKYNLYEYLRDFGSAWERVIAEGDRPILCGGTGLYIEAVLKGYNMVEVPVSEQLRAAAYSVGLQIATQHHRYVDYRQGCTSHRDSRLLQAKRYCLLQDGYEDKPYLIRYRYRPRRTSATHIAAVAIATRRGYG